MKDDYQTNLEVMTDISLDEQKHGITVLIKHDYFSTDNENGRRILDSLLDNLTVSADNIIRLIVIDTGVKLIDMSAKFNALLSSVRSVYICKDSSDYYGIDLSFINNDKVKLVNVEDIADIIIQNPPDLTID